MNLTGGRRICLVGATGLVGRGVIEAAVGREHVRVVAVSRRECALPDKARMEVLVAPLEGWPEAIETANCGVFVSALGTTMKAAGSVEAFRAVDLDLVVDSAKAARDAGIDHMIAVSSVGADPASRNNYLRIKGEAEMALAGLGFRRLDVLRPGLLRGPRTQSRPLESVAKLFAPIIDPFLLGRARKFRSVRSRDLARAIIALAVEDKDGVFIHEHDAIRSIFDPSRAIGSHAKQPGNSTVPVDLAGVLAHRRQIADSAGETRRFAP